MLVSPGIDLELTMASMYCDRWIAYEPERTVKPGCVIGRIGNDHRRRDGKYWQETCR